MSNTPLHHPDTPPPGPKQREGNSEQTLDLAAASQITAVPGQPVPTPAKRSTAEPSAAPLPPMVGQSSSETVGVYRLETKLGEGGMGAVWKASHTKLKKTVALKLLPQRLTQDPSLVARFEREMEAVGQLTHPNIVAAHDAGEINGTHYLAMEYIEGADLGKYVASRGPLPVRNATEIVRQAAIGLAHAHQHGMVHRDIKPSNLLLTKKGQVKLLDLGLARLQEEVKPSGAEGALTRMGQILGTPDYMAPEQWDDTHSVDARADLYALGCTLFFLLTGRAPYDDKQHATVGRKLAGHSSEAIPSLSAARREVARRQAGKANVKQRTLDDVPNALEAVYQKLMAKEPVERYQTANELLKVLPAIIKSEPLPMPAANPEQATADATAPESAVDAASPTAAFLPPEPVVFPPVEALPREPNLAIKQSDNHPPKRRILLIAAGFAGLVLLAGIVIKIRHKDGTTTTIEAPEDAVVEVIVPGKKSGEPTKPATGGIDGARTWQQWPADAPAPAIAPFDAAQARLHQQAWADYLEAPLEHTGPLGIKFRLIPPGEFLMGTDATDLDTLKNEYQQAGAADWQLRDLDTEAPQRRVTITRPFYLGSTEVTLEQFEKYAELSGAKTDAEVDGVGMVIGSGEAARRSFSGMNWRNRSRNPNSPASYLSWNDCHALCQFLSQEFQANYRLPTEAEWEFACRAGTTSRYHFGDAITPDQAAVATSPIRRVMGFPANAFGLFDMHGSQMEHCADTWDGNPEELSATVDPRKEAGGNYRALRTEARHFPLGNRSASRSRFLPSNRSPDCGVRLALDIDSVRSHKTPGDSTP